MFSRSCFDAAADRVTRRGYVDTVVRSDGFEANVSARIRSRRGSQNGRSRLAEHVRLKTFNACPGVKPFERSPLRRNRETRFLPSAAVPHVRRRSKCMFTRVSFACPINAARFRSTVVSGSYRISTRFPVRHRLIRNVRPAAFSPVPLVVCFRYSPNGRVRGRLASCKSYALCVPARTYLALCLRAREATKPNVPYPLVVRVSAYTRGHAEQSDTSFILNQISIRHFSVGSR